MSQIKAIQTEYKGYKFRSRLEARWAVFFDAVRIKWEYEPQGFECENGTKYLPDFYLPEQKIWCEVKPNETGRVKEFKKAFQCLSEQGNVDKILILPEIPKDNGTPPVHWFFIAYYNPLDECTVLRRACFTVGYLNIVRLATDHSVGKASEITGGMFINNNFHRIGWSAIQDYEMPYKDDRFYCDTLLKEETDILTRAYKTARQARFEHGETPN